MKKPTTGVLPDAVTAAPAADSRAAAAVGRILDRAGRLQEPAVSRYVAKLRDAHPDDDPAALIARLERRYLTAVTASGSAVGAAASIPGVGTFTALTALTADTAVFIEASALLALATAEVHGITVHESERRRALVLSVALGEEGVAALGKVLGTRSTGAVARLGRPGAAPKSLLRLNKTLTNRLVRKFAVRRAPILVGKLIPGGVGAAVGGAGNRALGRLVLRNAREAFGPPPRHFPIDGEVLTANRSADPAGTPVPAPRRRLLRRGRSS
ncbi:hypothetical protein [Gordonia sp. VNK21]|uniref:hypothetical protein n=1 Tax=Gordonia sp. VNK21 TaxID=3382483 RepID=UPI0038D4A79E